MKRNAKLFLLTDKTWELITNEIGNDFDEIAIFRIMDKKYAFQEYAIVSVSDKADEIIISKGGKVVEANDGFINAMITQDKELIFGNKEVLKYLNRPK